MLYREGNHCRYQALRPEWEIAGEPAATLRGSAPIPGAGRGWVLAKPGDLLSWQLPGGIQERRYLHLHYRAEARHGFLTGAVALGVNDRFETGSLPLPGEESGWLAAPLPASAFSEDANTVHLRSCNAYARITIHGLYLSAYRLPLQEHSMWCWAAILNSLDDYYGHHPARTQAEWACLMFGAGQCQSQAGCPRCRQAAYIHEALEQHGYLQTIFETPASEAEMLRELRSDRPVIITQKAARDVSGHFLLVFGINPDGTWATWNPRQNGIEAATYETLLAGGQPKRKWVNTFFTRDAIATVPKSRERTPEVRRH